MAITGTVLPMIYFFHRRFPGEKPAEANVIVRQAMWFGIYGATLAWLQLGRLVTVYIILGLAGGFSAIEPAKPGSSAVCTAPGGKRTTSSTFPFWGLTDRTSTWS